MRTHQKQCINENVVVETNHVTSEVESYVKLYAFPARNVQVNIYYGTLTVYTQVRNKAFNGSERNSVWEN